MCKVGTYGAHSEQRLSWSTFQMASLQVVIINKAHLSAMGLLLTCHLLSIERPGCLDLVAVNYIWFKISLYLVQGF